MKMLHVDLASHSEVWFYSRGLADECVAMVKVACNLFFLCFRSLPGLFQAELLSGGVIVAKLQATSQARRTVTTSRAVQLKTSWGYWGAL